MKLEALMQWYERLTPESLDQIGRLYQEEATFRDPFNQVRGLPAIRAVFLHMFETTGNPRFEVTGHESQGDIAWLRWNFECRLRGRRIAVEGASRLLFGSDGRVAEHRDYWDATDLFLQLPLLGTMVHFLKKRLSAKAGSSGNKQGNNER